MIYWENENYLRSISESLEKLSRKNKYGYDDILANRLHTKPYYQTLDMWLNDGILKAEIIKMPSKKEEQKCLIFNISKETNLLSYKLLSLSLLWILYSIYDLEIANLLWTSLKWKVENIPTIIFTLTFIELIVFGIYYYRDIKEHSVRKIKIDTEIYTRISTLKNKNSLLRKKKSFFYHVLNLYIKNMERWNSINVNGNILDEYFKSFPYDKSDESISNLDKKKIRRKVIDIYMKNVINEDIKIINKNVLDKIFSEAKDYNEENERKLSQNESELKQLESKISSIKLEKYNKYIVFIFLKWVYPVVFTIISLFFLYKSNLLNIDGIKKGYNFLWVEWIFSLLLFILVFFYVVNRLSETKD